MLLEPTITNSYSMDIIIKICGTLTTFIIFIFISAWHLTRRKYRFPHLIVEAYPIKNIKDLLSFHFLNACYKESKEKFNCGVIAAPALDGKMAVVVNDINWCFSEKSNLIFTVPFSLTPKCIKERWKGIIFSQDSIESGVLRCLIVKGFESIDWCVIDKSLDFGLRYDDDNKINSEVSSQLVSFEAIMGYSVDPENLEKKLIFITKLVDFAEEFSNYFYHGKVLSTDSTNPSEYVKNLTELLQPVVESSIFHSDSQYTSTIPVNVVSENVLSQVAKLRHHLREENASCNILTVDNFCHVLFEHYFVLNKVLDKCLRGVQYLMSAAPNFIDIIRKEILKEADVKDLNSIRLAEYHLEASISLVFTKSVTQELMRHLALGIDFDLSLTEREGLIGEFDMPEKSVIVLNHFAFTRSKSCHVKNPADSEMFRPGRFIKYDSTEEKYLFYNSEILVSFQDQWHIVGLPRNFICRMLLLLLIKTAYPNYILDMKYQKNINNIHQYELLYDLDTQFLWDWKFLAEE